MPGTKGFLHLAGSSFYRLPFFLNSVGLASTCALLDFVSLLLCVVLVLCAVFAWFSDADSIWLVLEFCEGGDLFKTLSDQGGRLDEHYVCVEVGLWLLVNERILATRK
jgi:serine/threonine protein kinase